MKKLVDVETPLANFFASGVLALEHKLGPLLWQLPPTLGFHPNRLAAFFDRLPRTTGQAASLAEGHDNRLRHGAVTTTATDRPLRHAVEMRHRSFETRSFVDLLRDHDIGLVVADYGRPVPVVRGGHGEIRVRAPARRRGDLCERVHAGGPGRMGRPVRVVAGGVGSTCTCTSTTTSRSGRPSTPSACWSGSARLDDATDRMVDDRRGFCAVPATRKPRSRGHSGAVDCVGAGGCVRSGSSGRKRAVDTSAGRMSGLSGSYRSLGAWGSGLVGSGGHPCRTFACTSGDAA